MADLLKVTGLWETKDKNGNLVLSGNMSPRGADSDFQEHAQGSGQSSGLQYVSYPA